MQHLHRVLRFSSAKLEESVMIHAAISLMIFLGRLLTAGASKRANA
jgi:hypothetical protein